MSAPPAPDRLPAVSEDGLSWRRATTLAERVGLVRREEASPADGAGDPTAEGRLQAWCAERPFDQGDWFARRLAVDGLTRAGLLNLLGEADAALAKRLGRQPMPWLDTLIAAYSPRGGARAVRWWFHHHDFTSIVEPLLETASSASQDRARALERLHPAVPLAADRAVGFLLTGLLGRLDWMLGRAAVLEMRVAGLSGTLAGADPGERFRNFVDRLSQPSQALAFLGEYPVLARLLVEAVERWGAASGEILARLAADWPDILSTLNAGEDPGELVGITPDVGDLHRGGRAVRIISFASGFKVVYKPRATAVDARFRELLAWLEERGVIPLRAAKVLERPHYGWVEFVASAACSTRDELERFYRRQGAYLAILHALNANDFHRENLIAAGEHPVLVDLESLCGPDYGRFDPANAESIASYEVENSVLRVMLLPYLRENDDQEAIEPSGLGGADHQRAIRATAEWAEAGTDRMHLSRARSVLSPTQNRPTLAGERVDPLDFANQIADGFETTYRQLIRLREELVDHLLGWAETEVRVILRTSQAYELLLEESYHPDLLRDALDRDRHFDRLWYGLDRSRFADLAARVIPYEIEDLWRGDIPIFTARAGSRDLWTADGRRLPGALTLSGLDMVKLRLQRFGEEDLGEQLWYLRGSLTALAIQTGHRIPAYAQPARREAPAGGEQFLQVAERVANRLAQLAKRRDGECAWIGLNETLQAGWSLHPLETDLYCGLPGIALFLAYLDAVQERDVYRPLIEGTLATLRKLKERRDRIPFLGAFNGWSGLLYAWAHIGCLWQREDLLAEAMEMLPIIEAHIEGDRALDLTRGCAGGIVTLLGLHRATGSARALELARRMGDRLVETARPFGAGLGWLTVSSPYRPLTGVSHGASGFAWALLELYGATGGASFREVARGALAFEADLYSPEAQNWPDLRVPLAAEGEDEPPPRYMAAWCHGACGIGLTRLRMLRHLDDPAIAADARNALETTLRYGFGSNHSLCHGDLGSLELLLEASRTLGEPRWAEELKSKASTTLASIEEHGFLCGIPLLVETPGLMDGLAGIGYGMLRLAAPERVPSVLLLEPPTARPASP